MSCCCCCPRGLALRSLYCFVFGLLYGWYWFPDEFVVCPEVPYLEIKDTNNHKWNCPFWGHLKYCRKWIISEFTQQDGRKMTTVKRLSVATVTWLFLACLSWSSLDINVSWSFTKRSILKGRWSLAKRFFKQSYCHACVSSLYCNASFAQKWSHCKNTLLDGKRRSGARKTKR